MSHGMTKSEVRRAKENGFEIRPCVACGGDSWTTVGWLAPTRADAHELTCDIRPACSSECAMKVCRTQAQINALVVPNLPLSRFTASA
jgi:hypothetical protein